MVNAPFYHASGYNGNVLLPTLLDKNHHVSRIHNKHMTQELYRDQVSPKGNNDELRSRAKSIQSKPLALQRCESFYHDALESQGASLLSSKGEPVCKEARGASLQASKGVMKSGRRSNLKQSVRFNDNPEIIQIENRRSMRDRMKSNSSVSANLPRPWTAATDPRSGRIYYWNQESGELQWDFPDNLLGQGHGNGKNTGSFLEYFLDPDTDPWSWVEALENTIRDSFSTVEPPKLESRRAARLLTTSGTNFKTSL